MKLKWNFFTTENVILSPIAMIKTHSSALENMKKKKHEIGTFCYRSKVDILSNKCDVEWIASETMKSKAKLCTLPSWSEFIDIVRIILVHLPLITLSIQTASTPLSFVDAKNLEFMRWILFAMGNLFGVFASKTLEKFFNKLFWPFEMRSVFTIWGKPEIRCVFLALSGVGCVCVFLFVVARAHSLLHAIIVQR